VSTTNALFALGETWIGVGLLLALLMGRRGHDPFAWWLLGTTLGPLALPLAISAERHREDRVWPVRAGRPGQGPVDVLVGLDGSAEAAAALATVLDLLGPRLGRLTLATVTGLDASVEHDRALARARAELERQGRLVQLRLSTRQHGPDDGRRVPALVLVAGRPAEALQRLAVEGGYDLLVVGTRGAGLSKVLLGSTATTLAAHAMLPVLLAGGGSGSARKVGELVQARAALQETMRDSRDVAMQP
jgi:nucleotide-binding universal stress UspA family protein